jgi:hypothetical protein
MNSKEEGFYPLHIHLQNPIQRSPEFNGDKMEHLSIKPESIRRFN